MSGKTLSLGPSGQFLAQELRRLRKSQRFTYAELSRCLSEQGRYIPTLGLRKIEAGQRRVDVDDLIALADVLHVPALSLLGAA